MLMENKILIIWNKPIHKTQEHAEQDEYTGSKDKGKKWFIMYPKALHSI